jgi:hypothetical protein
MSDDLTKTTPSEHSYNVLKFLTKSLTQFLPPGFSGTASEFFDLIISNPAVRRRDRFLMDLGRRLDTLAEKAIFDPKQLLDSDEVSAFLLHSIQIANRSRGEAKLAALREATVRGTIVESDLERAPSYVVLNLIDRFTEYHLMILMQEVRGRPMYTGGQIAAGNTDGLLYGHSVVTDPKLLKHPRVLWDTIPPTYYAERDTIENFKICRADLIATGLLTAIPQMEEYLEGRYRRERPTGKVADYQVSELGKLVARHIQPVDVE